VAGLTARNPLLQLTLDNEFFWTSGPADPIERGEYWRHVRPMVTQRRHAVCFRTAWESTYGELVKQGKIRPTGGRTTMHNYAFGGNSAAHTLGMVAQRYFHKSGATRETLGWIALTAKVAARLQRRPRGKRCPAAAEGRVRALAAIAPERAAAASQADDYSTRNPLSGG
jgi:hypothetical protein